MSVTALEVGRRISIARRLRTFLANPWNRPRALLVFTWAYIAWSIVPVLIAVQFSFNAGTSRSTWQGFSLRWYLFDPERSVLHDPSLRLALIQSLKLASLTMIIATPLGVAMALGLTRWRGRVATPVNFLMLFPLVTPEIVMGAALFLVFRHLYGVQLGTTAMLLGHVTFTLSYVVIVVRGRLLSIGREYEEAAMDLGAPPTQALRRVVLPLLYPAVFAALMIVFAISIDDFVISAFLTSYANTETIPIRIYAAARGQPNPALNALASIMLFASLVAITLAVLAQRRFIRRREVGGSAVQEFARFEI